MSDQPTDDMVKASRSDLLQLLGRYGLPPWPNGNGQWLGSKIDCAPLAAEMSAALDEVTSPVPPVGDAMELAWGLIANAYGGDWSSAPPEWRAVAESWRDTYWHPSLREEATS